MPARGGTPAARTRTVPRRKQHEQSPPRIAVDEQPGGGAAIAAAERLSPRCAIDPHAPCNGPRREWDAEINLAWAYEYRPEYVLSDVEVLADRRRRRER